MRILLYCGAAMLASCTATQPVSVAPAVAPVSTVAPTIASEPSLPTNWSGMQWMYGSGEGAAASIQTYRAFAAFALAAKINRPRTGVVVANPGNLATSSFVPCGNKPVAVILDADETMIQNLGYEYALAKRGLTSGGTMLKLYQGKERPQSLAMPGAVDALAALRKAGIIVIGNSNRDRDTAEGTAATLARAGLGTFVPGETLLTRGDIDGGRGKDGRRTWVAEKYCVVAMAGDTLGDFADGFNDKTLSVRARRDLASRFADRWGAGWFMLSNPVYGSQLDGTIDEVFPPDMRWDGKE